MPLIAKKQKTNLGVDVGSYAVKVVEMKPGTTRNEVLNVGMKRLLPGAIVDGEPMDRDAVVAAITEIYEEKGIENIEVASAICGRSVIIKKISLPSMETEELAESIIWEARHNIPYPYEETAVDYAILKPAVDSEDKNLDILVSSPDSRLWPRPNLPAYNVGAAAGLGRSAP